MAASSKNESEGSRAVNLSVHMLIPMRAAIGSAREAPASSGFSSAFIQTRPASAMPKSLPERLPPPSSRQTDSRRRAQLSRSLRDRCTLRLERSIVTAFGTFPIEF